MSKGSRKYVRTSDTQHDRNTEPLNIEGARLSARHSSAASGYFCTKNPPVQVFPTKYIVHCAHPHRERASSPKHIEYPRNSQNRVSPVCADTLLETPEALRMTGLPGAPCFRARLADLLDPLEARRTCEA